MNYYGPREIVDASGQGTGRYHYTCMNDGRIWAVGYCSPWRPCPDCDGRITNVQGMFVCDTPPDQGSPHCQTCNGRGCVLLPKAERCQGHATPEEACAHQKEYELDHAVFALETPKSREKSNHLFKCVACAEWTCGYAVWGPGRMALLHLCNAHCNRETLASLIKVGEMISSC